MAFTLLTGAFLPQVSGEIGNLADMQNARLEVMSFISVNMHGNSSRAADGTRLKDSRLISYLICDRNPTSGNPESGSVSFSSESPQVADFHDEEIIYRDDPGGCANNDNDWIFQDEEAAGDIARRDSYSTLLPVRGGGIAEVEVEYGVR